MKSTVIFIIVPSYSNNNWLNAKMMQITKAFISILNLDDAPIEVVDTYADINNYLDKADLLVVSTAGNVIIERDHLYNKIHSVPSTVGLIAHLLQFKEHETPYFHEQFFIINTRAFKHLDFDDYVSIAPKLIRSEEDMHDGHAPLYVTLGEDTDIAGKFGTKIMLDCLQAGYEVRNFDQDWRYPSLANDYVTVKDYKLPTRGYCYPKLHSDLFAECLRTLTLDNSLDEAQMLFITAAKQVLDFKVLNYWQYDDVSSVKPTQHVICPATGFLAELLAIKSGATRITFYDINKNNLEFKKHLYSSWNGIDYESFATLWASERGLSMEPTFELDMEKAKEPIAQTTAQIFNQWNTWRNIKVDFVHADLIKDIGKVLTYVDDTCIIHTSTILGIYPFTAIVHSEMDIEIAKDAIKQTHAQWIRS
jgi:hypothetical protein